MCLPYVPVPVVTGTVITVFVNCMKCTSELINFVQGRGVRVCRVRTGTGTVSLAKRSKMGRRATSTTKGGKYMNPTDQARKEARKRELKKNKKQRMAVRQAVIKTKDPKQMLAELDMLDEMELNPASNVPYNDKVVREKRMKLLENVQRITQYYLREDPDQGTELKRLLDDYRTDRLKKEVYYESVQNAQKVKIDSIPLPEAPFQTPQLSDIPLPGAQPHGILKKKPSYMISATTTVIQKEPPGPPPGPPPRKKKFKGNDPLLHPRPPTGPQTTSRDKDDAYDPEEGLVLGDNHSDDEKSDEEFQHRDEDEEGGERRRRRSRDKFSDNEDEDTKRRRLEEAGITPLQAMMLKLAGQAVPPKRTDEGASDQPSTSGRKVGFTDTQPKPPPGPPPGLPPGPPSMPPRMVPPGPPPGVPPTIPRGPPPGLPPSLQMRMNAPPGHPAPGNQEMYSRGPQTDKNPGNILSAPPSLVQHRQERDHSRPGMIVAKPQIITNPKVDVTRFMPTSLRVKRQNVTKIDPNRPQDTEVHTTSHERQRQDRAKKQSKVNADDAYDSFMKEMSGLL